MNILSRCFSAVLCFSLFLVTGIALFRRRRSSSHAPPRSTSWRSSLDSRYMHVCSLAHMIVCWSRLDVFAAGTLPRRCLRVRILEFLFGCVCPCPLFDCREGMRGVVPRPPVQKQWLRRIFFPAYVFCFLGGRALRVLSSFAQLDSPADALFTCGPMCECSFVLITLCFTRYYLCFRSFVHAVT